MWELCVCGTCYTVYEDDVYMCIHRDVNADTKILLRNDWREKEREWGAGKHRAEWNLLSSNRSSLTSGRNDVLAPVPIRHVSASVCVWVMRV